ncbi:hypothetical protein L3X38_008535 [Prunus dulcis]|uniref:HMA domain-containing protein n=1 Tax=Prunus dulcis TaxID=3755 RepID=A0AAD5F783_PRUDU|nr:hypothetical protein L3X38_008535 [Prunus dulcis]
MKKSGWRLSFVCAAAAGYEAFVDGVSVFKVGMSCQGCVGAVKRVLGKLEGVESYDIDFDAQKVTVKSNLPPETVLQTVSKTGKKTAYWEAEAPTKPEAKPVAAA